MDEKIKDFRIKQRLLELDVDRFFHEVDVWSRRLAYIAIGGATIMLIRMIMEVSR